MIDDGGRKRRGKSSWWKGALWMRLGDAAEWKVIFECW
jgi:hypothetical protein